MKAKTKVKTKTSERIIISLSVDEARHIADFVGNTTLGTVARILNVKDELLANPCNDILTEFYHLLADQIEKK